MGGGFRVLDGRTASRGFSLVELLVTLAVIALALGVGIPMYGSFTQDSAVSGATSEFIASINDARSRAAAERAEIRLDAIDDDWSNGWRTVRVIDDEVLFNVIRTDRSVRIEETMSGATDIRFDKSGRVSAPREFQVGLVEAVSGTPRRALALSPLGRVEVESSRVP